jgi:hypothetical protein
MELKQIAPDYSVSPDGNVWSHKNGKLKQLKPMLSGKFGGCQYHAVALCHGGKYARKYVHRLIAEAFIGEIPSGYDVCHNDGNPFNNDVCNLRIDTRAGNLADNLRHGTHQNGERNHRAKLTTEQVEQIKAKRDRGASLKELAAEYSVRESTVSRIANNIRRARG